MSSKHLSQEELNKLIVKEELNMMELFAGTGAQMVAAENLYKDGIVYIRNVATSDIKFESIVSYAVSHDGLTMDSDYLKYSEGLTALEMYNELKELNIGMNYNTGVFELPNDEAKLRIIYAAVKLSNNLGDITRIDPNEIKERIDILTYSFPCQDISTAGTGKGFEKGSGTRSSLLWEVEKFVDIKKPRILLMENVPAILNNSFMPSFRVWVEQLEQHGYNTYYGILNANDFNCAQARSRAYAVSILQEYDSFYSLPLPLKSKRLCVKDILDPSIDTYVSNKKLMTFKQAEEREKEGYLSLVGYFGTKKQSNLVYSADYACPTICTSNDTYVSIDRKIRELAPLELWRLSCFKDETFDDVVDVLKHVSNASTKSDITFIVGNSIVSNVIYYILKNVFVEDNE